MFKNILFCVTTSCLVAATGWSADVRTVRFASADDVQLSATYYPVEADNAPAVLLLHNAARSGDEWKAFASYLQRNGIAALAPDLRGHGESTRRLTAQGPDRMDYTSFKDQDFRDMLLDVNAAADWLTDQPGIDKRRIAVAGAGLGANIALRYTTINEDIAALLLLSPGISYRGVRTDDVMKKLRPMPVRIVVARTDNFSFNSTKELTVIRKTAGIATPDKDIITCSGNLHGTEMINNVDKLPAALLEWLQQSLGMSPPPTPTPPAPVAPAAPKK